jgi:hypothetical protein
MVIGEIQKNSTENIRVSTESYKGYEFVDIRVYVMNDIGEWIPTKKGVTIAPEKVEELVKFLLESREKFVEKNK